MRLCFRLPCSSCAGLAHFSTNLKFTGQWATSITKSSAGAIHTSVERSASTQQELPSAVQRFWQEKRDLINTSRDTITERPLKALSAALNIDLAQVRGHHHASALPLGWHHLFFLPYEQRNEDTGPDGHDKRMAPPEPFIHRMWGGATTTFHNPLHVGDEVVQEEQITDVSLKRGSKGGPMLIVNLRHQIFKLNQLNHQNQLIKELAITEDRKILYRSDKVSFGADQSVKDKPRSAIQAELSIPTEQPQWSESTVPDSMLLFRYSALTYNSHKIHYDHKYCTEVEGYPGGVLVHGPLTATMLINSFTKNNPQYPCVQAFQYRAVKPLFVDTKVTIQGRVCGEGEAKLWALDQNNDLAMWAIVHFAK